MIRSYEDLAVTRKQLTRAEDALVDLHQTVFARNPNNYALFAEAYIDMILQLRVEIDEFLGIASAQELPASANGNAAGEANEAGRESAPTQPLS